MLSNCAAVGRNASFYLPLWHIRQGPLRQTPRQGIPRHIRNPITQLQGISIRTGNRCREIQHHRSR